MATKAEAATKEAASFLMHAGMSKARASEFPFETAPRPECGGTGRHMTRIGDHMRYRPGMRDVDVTPKQGKFQQTITIGPHAIVADEPTADGGEDAGPAPHEILLAALGACTSMTVKMYADRKGMKLDDVHVHLTREKHEDRTVLRRTVRLEGTLTPEERARLIEIAGKCPVHRTLTGKLELPVAEAQ
jgi:putative redox protein